jgi:hypothetical protein
MHARMQVSFCCANKLWEKALEAKDAWSVEQLEFGICQMVQPCLPRVLLLSGLTPNARL